MAKLEALFPQGIFNSKLLAEVKIKKLGWNQRTHAPLSHSLDSPGSSSEEDDQAVMAVSTLNTFSQLARAFGQKALGRKWKRQALSPALPPPTSTAPRLGTSRSAPFCDPQVASGKATLDARTDKQFPPWTQWLDMIEVPLSSKVLMGMGDALLLWLEKGTDWGFHGPVLVAVHTIFTQSLARTQSRGHI